jgi:hypothetical protein
MKTLNFITRTIAIAMIVVSMSTTLDAQKGYHKVTLENGIAELNTMANRLIEKWMVKFDVKNSAIVSELESTTEASAENELNGMIDQLSENVKFDVNNTISVNEASAENNGLDQAADELMANLKFDVTRTISVTEAMEENSELTQLTNQLMENLKFDVTQTNSVAELNEENNELSQLTEALISSNAKFDLNKTNSIQAEQIAAAF